MSRAIALFYGGKSTEHAVSCRSAANIANKLIASNYHVIPISCDREGRWALQQVDFSKKQSSLPSNFNKDDQVTFFLGDGIFYKGKKLNIYSCFPLIHGNVGEDGKIQSLLELTNLAYIGSNVKASLVGIHKELTKEVAKINNVPTLDYIVVDKRKIDSHLIDKLWNKVMVKPEDGGSSVGITPLTTVDENNLKEALEKVFKFSNKAILEPLLTNFVELEVAVLEVENSLAASLPGLVVDPLKDQNKFLTYQQKYLGSNVAYIEYPAPLEYSILEKVKEYALVVAKAIGVTGYARVDFFYNYDDQKIYFNEINTVPGLSEQSHWPILASSLGYDWNKLLELLIIESIERFNFNSQLIYKDIE
ncbi:MAG: D-alanine--D-alanine ligase [Sphaerochaetaceae bacterium]|jgi:D-alanine-D-alanine ligase